MSQDEKPLVNIISLGAGVQSSTMALMASLGEIGPMPDAAIFADTQDEPESVYKWLDWLEPMLKFPVYRVTRGSLSADELRMRISKKGYPYMKSNIPAYVKNPNGSRGILGRKCTPDFKIAVVRKKLRELLGIKRGGKKVLARMWVGISWDEIERMKESNKKHIENIWPLIGLKMTREGCLRWMKERGYPEPPRSACRFCPFHSDTEWERLKRDEPLEFERAAQFEDALQKLQTEQKRLKGVPFLHPSLVPIREVSFVGKVAPLELFKNECEGLCGV